MQVCRAWRSATDLPYVWRRLCWRKRLLLDGEEEGEEDGEEQMVQEEIEEPYLIFVTNATNIFM